MNNSEVFLDYYNMIDKFLKKDGQFDTFTTFTQKIKLNKKKVVRHFQEELISLGELRNAIVHNPRYDNKAIAEPHTETVERIKSIYEMISKPKKFFPEFQFEVLGANEEDYINSILIEMNKKSFSQFPIFDNNKNIIELINTNSISRWLSLQLEEKGTILIENVKIKDFIPHIEFKKNYKFISKNYSIYDAYYLFINQINTKNRNLDVLFISENGKEHEKLLGLITIEDIANRIKYQS